MYKEISRATNSDSVPPFPCPLPIFLSWDILISYRCDTNDPLKPWLDWCRAAIFQVSWEKS